MAQTGLLRPKLQSKAPKRAGVHVNSMKTMLLAAYSGYFTSVASENVVLVMKIGPEGDKLKKIVHKNSTLRPKLHFDATKRLLEQYMSCKSTLEPAKSQLLHFGCF